MNKKELIKKIAAFNNMSITQTEAFFNSFEQVLSDAIASNQEVVLSSRIGKFVLKPRAERVARNPQTGEKITIPAKTVVTFKFSKNIKDKVKSFQI